MTMGPELTPEQERILDEALLRTLEAQDTRFGLQSQAMAVLLFPFGLRPTPAQVERRLQYLADPQIEFVRPVDATSAYHAYERAYRITPKGMNHLRGG